MGPHVKITDFMKVQAPKSTTVLDSCKHILLRTWCVMRLPLKTIVHLKNLHIIFTNHPMKFKPWVSLKYLKVNFRKLYLFFVARHFIFIFLINKIRLHGQETRRISWRPTRMRQQLTAANFCSIQRIYTKGYRPIRKYTVRKICGGSGAEGGNSFNFLQGEIQGGLLRLRPSRSPVELSDRLSGKVDRLL